MEPLDRTGWTLLSGDPDTSTPNLGYHYSYPDSGPATPSFPSPSLFPSSSSNVSSQSVPFQGSSTLMTAVISLSVFVVGLIGNTLAIYVVLRYAKMKTVTNIYILNLAVADELYILGLPFLTTQNVLSYWPFGSFLCRMLMTADSMSQFTSIFCLTVMSIDRYLAVVHPIRSTKWRRPRVAKVVSAAVWALSLVVVLPVVVFSGVQDTFNSCNISWPEPQDVWSTVFILYTATLGFFGPLLVICLCYLLIVVKADAFTHLQHPIKTPTYLNALTGAPSGLFPHHLPTSDLDGLILTCVPGDLAGFLVIIFKVKSSGVRAGFTKRRRSERKVTRMVVIIVVVFVLCWLPFFIINIINLIIIIPESSVTAGVYFFSVILSYVNSCANPLLYGFLSDNFRQSFRKVLCVRKANGVEDGDPSAPRMEKTRETTRDDSFLSPRNHDGHNGHTPQNSQAVQLEPCGSPGEKTRPSGPTVICQSSL